MIVADSQSTDGTAEYLAQVRAAHPNVHHVPGPYGGRAMARNAGIEAARAPTVLFTDADIIAQEDLLERHLERHAANEAVAIVGMELQVASLDEYASLRARPELRKSLHPSSRKRLSWLYFLTGNASVRKADLDRVGRFDSDFTGYGHEDLELGFRLERAGVAIRYEPRAVNYHWHPVPHAEQEQKMRLAGRSTVRFYRKHPSWVVQARLGMNPVSLALHGAVEKRPRLLARLEGAAASHPGIARTLVYQYHYVGGIKEALAGQHAGHSA